MYNFTATYAAGPVTSLIGELIQKVVVYPGTKEYVQAKHPEPVLIVDNAQLPRASVFSLVRSKSGNKAGVISAVNPALAVTLTPYYGYSDIYIDLEGGDYYVTFDINAVGVLAGAVVTALVTNIIAHFIDEGRPVLRSEHLAVGLRAASNGFDYGQIREFCLMSAAELSAAIGTLTFDENISIGAIAMLEEEANLKVQGANAQIAAAIGPGTLYTLPVIDIQDRTGLLPLYLVYKSSYDRATLHVVTAAATALAYGIAY